MLLTLIALQAHAGERHHAWSYSADTVPKGGIEVEHYGTVKTTHPAGDLVAAWQHQVELEYGITDALEGGLYLVAAQEGEGPLSFSGYKGRLRYRFWPIGEKALDVAAYFEYIGAPSFDEHGFEVKAILSKQTDLLVAALNVTGELELAGDEVEPVLEPTLGVAWRATSHASFGGEAKFETVFVDPIEGPFLWVGPSAHLAGEGGRLWWTMSALFGVTGPTRDDAEIQARSLIGINL